MERYDPQLKNMHGRVWTNEAHHSLEDQTNGPTIVPKKNNPNHSIDSTNQIEMEKCPIFESQVLPSWFTTEAWLIHDGDAKLKV